MNQALSWILQVSCHFSPAQHLAGICCLAVFATRQFRASKIRFGQVWARKRWSCAEVVIRQVRIKLFRTRKGFLTVDLTPLAPPTPLSPLLQIELCQFQVARLRNLQISLRTMYHGYGISRALCN